MKVNDDVRAKVVADPTGMKRLMLTPSETLCLRFIIQLGPQVAVEEITIAMSTTKRYVDNMVLSLYKKGYVNREWFVEPFPKGGYYRYTSRF